MKIIEQESKKKSPFSPQEEITLQSATMEDNNSTPHPHSGMWMLI
jgi:hypothetical protein